jgi:hypothetical protein
LSAVVKSAVEVPGEVTANNSFRAKHTDDCRIDPRVSKLCNFYPAKVGGSKDACNVIGESQPSIAVRGFALSSGQPGESGSIPSISTPYLLSCPACLQRLPQLVAHAW